MQKVWCCIGLTAGHVWQKAQVMLLLEWLSCSGCFSEVLLLSRTGSGCTELAAGPLGQTAESEPMLLHEGGLHQNGDRNVQGTGISTAAGQVWLEWQGEFVGLRAELMLLSLAAPP